MYPAPEVLQQLLQHADVQINGSRPWDLQVRNPALYRRVLTQGSLGFGESYMDGDWDVLQMDVLFDKLMRADLDRKVAHLGWANRLRLLAEILRNSLFNRQSSARAFQVGEQHYDVGNDLFERMLDSHMAYSCGYWKTTHDLEQAQHDKLDLICQKLELKPGERLLEIGVGWGSLARFAAEHYGVSVLGLTVSREQQQLAQTRCAGLPVEIALQDYREIQGQFDKIVSVGMFEHVGQKNYASYFDVAQRCLKPEGLFLLHTIGVDRVAERTDPWIDRYIFPNGRLPAASELSAAVETQFVIEDWHNFGPDYDKTLMAWWEKFDQAWPDLQAHYGERFYRMWRYYLMSSAGFFRSRQGQLWQLVLSKRGRNAVYRAPR